jgi:hypothetical protein
MAEKRLGDALVELNPAGVDDAASARRQADKVLRRDNWRLRLLAAVTIFLSVLSATGILGLVYFFTVWIFPGLHHIAHDLSAPKGPPDPQGMKERLDAISYWSATAIDWAGTISVVAMILAVLCGILLVFASRRAALRVVDASLKDLSEQVRQLQQSLNAPSNASRPPKTG